MTVAARMPNSYALWSEAEDDLIRESFPKMSNAEMADLFPDRTEAAVIYRAWKLGFVRTRRKREFDGPFVRRRPVAVHPAPVAVEVARPVAVEKPAELEPPKQTGPRVLRYSELEPGMVVNVRPVGRPGAPMFRRITDARTTSGREPYFMLSWEGIDGARREFPGNGWKVRAFQDLRFEVRG